ncbi:MAG TPA: DinB family protein [Puia sp.]|nr:DinB family protein [Puia sp.]
MNFTLEKSIQILERTPNILDAMLQDISSDWTTKNEGDQTWSAYDIIGHLIHGEKTDWIPRVQIIVSKNSDKKFNKFDRFAQFEASKGKSLAQLLAEFALLRKMNVQTLRSLNLSNQDLEAKGIHPAFGEVSLSQLLSTWVVHDLNHIAQISRVMAKLYKDDVGPWIEYLAILRQ